MKTGDELLGVNNVDDYLHRPKVFEDTCLYDYFQMTERRKTTKKQRAEFNASLEERGDQSGDVDMPHVHKAGLAST